MKQLHLKIRRLQFALVTLLCLNVIVLILSFGQKGARVEKFEEISVSRINLVDKNGNLKTIIASQDMLFRDSKDANRSGENSYSGMLFLNEEGEECGGLIYNGRKTSSGQVADAGLTFDQYRQDQNIVLMHKENVDSAGSSINDGLAIIQRPNYTKVKEEYQKYAQIEEMKLTKEQKDSVRSYYAAQDIIGARRLFLGTDRGVKKNKPYNETGLTVKNRAGNTAIKIFVDYDNVPHFEVYDVSGKKKVYELKFKN